MNSPSIHAGLPTGRSSLTAGSTRTTPYELRTVDTDGSNVRALYQQKSEMAFPLSWSPDGRSIAVGLVRDFYKSYDLGLISVADGSLKIVKTPPLLKTGPGNMVFSPDGRYLIIDLPQKDGDPKHDIFAFSVDGREETRIAEHPAEDSVLDWIPGTNDLLFLSDRTGTPDAWIVGFADGRTRGEPRLVQRDLGRVTPLGLSREGSFFYRRGSEMTDIAIASIDLVKPASDRTAEDTAASHCRRQLCSGMVSGRKISGFHFGPNRGTRRENDPGPSYPVRRNRRNP